MSSMESLAPGIIVAGDGEQSDALGELSQSVLEDITYNILHDLLLQTHREEKLARARTAAILVEQKAEELGAVEPQSPSEQNPVPQEVETDAATYISRGSQGTAEICLKGNPLKTTTEIRCGRCKLPRLLHPTDGVGAQKPIPGKEYCKKRPYITKPYFDIYGQTFQPEGPGRGKKKKDFVNPALEQAAKEGTPNGSQDSTGGSPSAEGSIKPLSYPHSKCLNCGSFMPIRRMNNHMNKCIGGGGRDSSRTALLKMKNGNSNGITPPVSRSSTPVPGAKDAKFKSSPRKREAEDLESEDSPHKKKKFPSKKSSSAASSHMIKLKAPGMIKSSSQLSASNLSFEQRASNSEDEEYEEASIEGDDDHDGEYGSSDSKKKKKKATTKKKLKDSTGAGVKKIKSPRTGSKPILPPVRPTAKFKNGTSVNGKDRDALSESSQTLSSPN